MKRLIFLTGLFSIFTFISCNEKAKEGLSFDCGSFSEQNLNYDDAQKYVVDSLLLGIPISIKVHPDGFIVIKDMQAEKQIIIVDLKDGSTQEFIPRGRGPLELLIVWDLEIHNGDVWVSGPKESKIIKLSLNKDTRKFEIADTFDLSGTDFMRAFPFSNDNFLILSNPAYEKRMEIVDKGGNILREVGSFPDVKISDNITINNAFLQSEITISPDNKHTAVACRSIDYIDIYDSDMKLMKRLRGPIGAEPEFMEQEFPDGGIQFVQKPKFLIFQTATSNNDMFFVSYTGVEVKSEHDFGKYPHKIFSFDWNGKPLQCYNIDVPVMCFDVDWNNKKLYCITHNPEPEILIFDI